MSNMSHSNSFWYQVFFFYLRRMKVLTTDFLVFFFCLNIPIVLWVDYLCPFCHIQISYLSYFFCLTNIFRETELSHVCHISVDTAICHFHQLWTACPEPFVPSHSHVGVYIVMVCQWTDHILARSASWSWSGSSRWWTDHIWARNPFLEVEADLPGGGDFPTCFSLIKRRATNRQIRLTTESYFQPIRPGRPGRH